MRSQLYDAVEEETQNEFELLAELGGGTTWIAILGRRRTAPAPLAILLLQAADEDGEFDLETVETLDEGLPLGHTDCPSCGSGAEGWPRFCPVCGVDVTGAEGDQDVPGAAAKLLDEVRAATAGVYEVLGEMRRTEGGGTVYFAREAGTGRIVGLALRHDADGELDLSVSWIPSAAGDPAPDADARAPQADPSAGDAESFVSAEPLAIEDPGTGPAYLGEPPRPLFGPPAGTRGRAGDRARRAAGIAAVSVVGVALAAALVTYVFRPDAKVEVDTLAKGSPVPAATVSRSEPAAEQPAPPAPATGEDAPGESASSFPSVSPATRETPSVRPPVSPPPSRPEGTSAAVAAGPSVPVSTPAPEPAAAPTPDGITEAVGRYAAAVQSRQTSRISRAYPGITRAEVDRWERFYRPLGADAGLQARYDVLRPPTVTGTRGEILFTLTLSYTDAAGRLATVPLPLRGILEWTGRGWSLEEVRSYP